MVIYYYITSADFYQFTIARIELFQPPRLDEIVVFSWAELFQFHKGGDIVGLLGLTYFCFEQDKT